MGMPMAKSANRELKHVADHLSRVRVPGIAGDSGRVREPDRGRRRLARAMAAIGLFLLVAATSACRYLLRSPVDHLRPGQEEDRLLDRMNVSLLTNLVAKRLVIEVDWVEGCEPAPIALEALERVAREYCPLEIRVVKDDVIPRRKWEGALGE